MYIRSQKGFLLCNAAAIASIKTDKSKITNTIFAEMVVDAKPIRLLRFLRPV